MAKSGRILRGDLISAGTIYLRYKSIIDSLITKANQNIAALTSQINGFVNSTHGTASEDAFENLQTTSYHEAQGNSYVYELRQLSGKLKQLEQIWYDSNNLDNSAHGGVKEYKTDYTDYDSRKSHPLHVIKNNSDKYAADGRVNQSDFIGAYHFQNTIESLYSIASRLRDIQIRIKRVGSGSTILSELRIGQDNPYIDLRTIQQHDYISSDAINVNALSATVIPFHDWILNNTLNGGKIAVNESSKQERGWIKTNTDPNLRYPSALANAMSDSGYFINRNTNGRQITRNLRDRTSEVTSYKKDEPTKLSNFYHNSDSADKYGKQPISGIAKEYLTLKFGTSVNNQNEITAYTTPSAQLSSYFQKVVTEEYTGTGINKEVVLSTNVIRSKERGKKHIVCAEKVNQMFKKMNEMLVQISSSLYGKYSYTFEEGEIPSYGSGNPIGGLGYPEVMSWYTGTAKSGAINFLDGDLIQVNTYPTNYFNGSIRNDSYVAHENLEDDSRWNNPIKAGYPWMTYSYRTSAATKITNFTQVYSKLKASVVPMSYNKSQSSTEISPDVKKTNLTTKKAYGTTNGNGTYIIENTKQSNVNKQVFTRYSISHPMILSAEQRITADFYRNSTPALSAIDINAKYLIMPYMMYLDDWYNTAHNNQKVGNFLNRDIYVDKAANKFYSECGMPVQCINRNKIWDANTIKGSYNNISVGLIAKTSSGQKYLIGKEYSINWIRYLIKGILNVNEVNVTHDGWARLGLSVGTTSILTTTVDGQQKNTYLENPYKNPNDGHGTFTRTISSNTGNISSSVYYGKNGYSSSAFNNDAIDTMYCDRYKFNDFYDDDDLLTKEYLAYGNLKEYFACGANNDYLGDNRVMYWKWTITKSLRTGSKQLKLHPYFYNTTESENWFMIQGHFFFSGNHSDEMDVSSLGTVTYKYVPLPQHVTITEFTVDPTISTDNILIKGYCSAWWNNLANVSFTINFNNASHTITTFSASKIYSRASRYPEAGNRPFAANQVEGDATLNGSNPKITVSSKWKSENSRFEFDISCSKAFPDDYAGEDLTVSYRFTNEDGGYRSYSGQTVSTVSSPDFSQSYSFLVPYAVHKTAANVKVGSFISDYTQISTRTLALNEIDPSSVSSNVSLLETSTLAWGSNDGQLTVSNSDDFNIMTSSDTPVYNDGIGGWVNAKTKVKITSSVSSQLTDGQKIIMNVSFGSINGGSGDGVSIFFGDEDTNLRDINSFTEISNIIKRQLEPSSQDGGWGRYNSDIEYNKSVIYGLLVEHFDNIPSRITQSNIISNGGKVLVDPKQDGQTTWGEVPKNSYIDFKKFFTIHKSSDECYIINNVFINLGGDSYHILDDADWGAFGIKISPISS